MNQDIIQGKWTQIKGSLKTQWGKLTDDDLARMDGNRHYLDRQAAGTLWLAERAGRTGNPQLRADAGQGAEPGESGVVANTVSYSVIGCGNRTRVSVRFLHFALAIDETVT